MRAMHRRAIWVWALFMVLVANVKTVSGSKVLLIPFMAKSHLLYFQQIASALKKQGHELTAIMNDKCPYNDVFTNNGVSLITYRESDEKFPLEDVMETMTKGLFDPSASMVGTMWKETPKFVKQADMMFNDTEFVRKVKDGNFSLCIIDGLAFQLYHYVVPYKFDIPYITLATIFHPWAVGLPDLPSFAPSRFGGFTEKMTFLERLGNVVQYLGMYLLIHYFPSNGNGLVSKHAPEKPFKTPWDLLKESQFWLLNGDPLLDYPHVAMPHIAYVGGMTTKEGGPLVGSVHKIVSEATHGVIVVSFGSVAGSLPKEMNQRLLSTFYKLKQTVIWRYIGPELGNLPKNVHVFSWIPQNDLLADNKTQLFITHCGNNGQFEALFHGIPMIGLPIMADQFYNAARMQYHKYGLALDTFHFTHEELLKAVNTVLEDKSFKSSIKKASMIYRNRPIHARENAAFWINHVLQYGAEHLRSYSIQMPWYQYWMLDVIFFFTAMGIGILYVNFKVICIVLKYITSKKAGKEKTS